LPDQNAGVQPALVDDLEEFIRRGGLWQQAELQGLIDRLEGEADATGDAIPRLLAHPLRALLVRMSMGDVSTRMANDVEGILYPRIWKVMEAARDGLPDGELRTRIEVLNRRLSRRLVEERPG
jgi:hypothetical protein